MPGLLSEKIIFLTGGSAGTGFECAKAYAREGAQVRNAIHKVLAKFGRLDAIHNNGGIASPSATERVMENTVPFDML
jgi:NAD(P)-dependent dehydrogenase (short-subunit alcohol dehydrogenase family)